MFDEYIIKNIIIDSKGCWIWQKYKNSAGYGVINKIKREFGTSLAHRISYMLYFSQNPNNLNINHKCNVSSCVNPHHLYMGTQKDNMRDVALSGIQKGQNNPQSKLKNNDVVTINKLVNQGWTQQAIAKHYGVHPSQISDIKTGRRWSHITNTIYKSRG